MTTERMGVDPLESLAAWCNEKGIGQGEWVRRSDTYAVVAELVAAVQDVYVESDREPCGVPCPSCRIRAALRPFTGEQA